jgi:putative ABC transport system permease protein
MGWRDRLGWRTNGADIEDIEDEIESHLQLAIQDRVARGQSPQEARRAALLEFGSVRLVTEDTQAVWRGIWPWLQDGLQDVRFAVRLLAKDRWFTLVAALTLGLGIGVNNTLFTIVNALCIRGLPIARADRMVSVGARDVHDRELGVSLRDFQDLQRSMAPAIAGLAAFAGAAMPVGDEGRAPDRVLGTYISANAFELIGERPLLGRDFLPEEDQPGADAVVILGSGVWRTRYGGDLSVVGRSVQVNGVPSLVIGVMRDRFKFPNNADLWLPLALMPGLTSQGGNVRSLSVFGRLVDGITLARAQTELNGSATRLAHDYPETNAGIGSTAVPINDRYNGRITDAVWISFMAVGAFVVLIACANVANLLLMRSIRRAHEIAIRASLGASRYRLVRQLLVESAALAAAGGVVGFALSIVGLRLFQSAIPEGGLPFWVDLTMDDRVFAVLAGVSVGTVFVFGLVPAFHVSKTDVHAVLKEGGRGSGGRRASRWTAVFLTAQVALTMVLLAGMGVGLRGFLAVQRADLVVDTTHLLTMSVALPSQTYPTADARMALYRRLGDRLAAIPLVSSATIAGSLPISGASARQLTIDGRPPVVGEPPPTVWTVAVGPNYFETMGLRLREGHAFNDQDGTAGFEYAIVNQRFADMYFANDDPVGRRIRLTDGSAPNTTPWHTIVGISPSVRQRSVGLEPDPVVYLPLRGSPPTTAALIVRAVSEPAAITSLVRDEVRALDPDLPVFRIRTMDQVVSESRWNPRVSQGLVTVIAFVGLLLAAVGLYAVNAYSVVQRTKEIGVRVALGAQRAQVLWLVLRGALFQVALGAAFGVVGAVLWDRPWEVPARGATLRYGMTDPVVLLPVAALLTVVALAASVLPAGRAARLDPAAALRHE